VVIDAAEALGAKYQMSEIRSQMSGKDRGRRTEDGGRRTEDGGRRTEDGRRMTEDRRRNYRMIG
jgi:hypothetical protein